MEITRDNRNVPPIDERITILERKVKEMEALLKGLTDEMLDLKSVAMRLSKSEDRRTEMRAVKPSSGQQSTVIMPKKTAQVNSGMRVPQPVPEKEPEKMDMIMQPDGTLKPERRKSSDYIVASAGYGKKAKPGRGSGSRSGNVIVAEDEDEEPQTKK